MCREIMSMNAGEAERRERVLGGACRKRLRRSFGCHYI